MEKELLNEVIRIRKNVVFFFWLSIVNLIVGGIFGSAVAVASIAAAA